jgi:hypothetical protein
LLSSKNAATVPHPFYYRRVRHRPSRLTLTGFGIVLGSVLAILVVIYLIHLYFD